MLSSIIGRNGSKHPENPESGNCNELKSSVQLQSCHRKTSYNAPSKSFSNGLHNAGQTICIVISDMPHCKWDHIWQVLSPLAMPFFTDEEDELLRHLCFSEFSQSSTRSLPSPHAVTYLLCAVLMETKHVVWQVHSFVLPNFRILFKSFCIPSLPPNVSLPTKQARLIRCLNVAANLGHCYFSGDSLFSDIRQQRKSGCATGVRCKSNRSDLADIYLLNAYVQQSCLQNATAVQGSCSPVDISCLCSSALYSNSLACCLSKNCNQADQECMQPRGSHP